MKKVFAILLVLALVAGFAFADDPVVKTSESHNIKVKADVTRIIPVFALRMGNQNRGVAEVVTNTTTGPNETTHQYTNNFDEAATSYTKDTAVDVKFNLDEGGSVVFEALLLNKAKDIKVYKLEFGGGTFADTKVNNVVTPIVPTITTSDYASVIGCVVAEIGNAAAGGATNKKLSVTFDGKSVNGETDPIPEGGLILAKATYEYAATNVDMKTENDGFYETNVSLTVLIN